jgi:hypothetical protein
VLDEDDDEDEEEDDELEAGFDELDDDDRDELEPELEVAFLSEPPHATRSVRRAAAETARRARAGRRRMRPSR